MAINTAARAKLINKTGIIANSFAIGSEGMQELFKRAATAHRVQWTNIKWNLKKRGVDNPDELPGYYYRDDGIKIWDAIEEYVREIINVFYDDDKDVQNDSEVQNWANDIHTNAFPGYNGAPQGHGFPAKMQTKEELVEYCTLIMFTGSAQHAAVNFGQFDTYGYAPNAPVGMRRPPASERGLNPELRHVMASLPDSKTAAAIAFITSTLSELDEDEIFLGNYPKKLYAEENLTKFVKKFQEKLIKIEGEIKDRNKTLDVQYHHLLPSRIPNSISI